MKKKNKILYRISVLLIALALILSLPLYAFGDEDPDPTYETEETDPLECIKYGACYCVESQLMMFSVNVDQQFAPWSAVKLMNALVVSDSVDDLDTTFEIEKGMIRNGSNVYGLKAGSVVSYYDLLVLELLRGVDDASYVLARKVAGSDDAFIELMNQKAKKLGTEKTMFMSVSGNEGSGLTTVNDIVRIAEAVLEDPSLASICSKGNIKCETLSDTIFNRNVFLSGYYNNLGKAYINKNVTGLIAASLTDPAMVILSEKSGEYTYINVLYGSSEEKLVNIYDAAKVFPSLFYSRFSYRTILSVNTVVCEIPVIMGYEHDSLVVTPGSDFNYYLLDDCDVEKEFSYEYELISDSVEAPVKNGQVVGTVRLLRNGELVGTADLIVRANVSRSVSEYYKEQVKSLIFGNFFIKALIVIVCIAVVYILIVSIYKGQKQKKERKRQQEEDY